MKNSPHWPRWYPNRRLTADDLHGFEDYVFARSALADPAGPGVEFFDLRELVEIGGQMFLAGPLAGLTPDESPVRLRAGQNLSCELSSEIEFDLTVVLDRSAKSPQDADFQKEADFQKLALVTRQAMGDAELDLGRIRRSDSGFTIIRHPIVRRFGAIRQVEATDWLLPLANLLNKLLADARNAPAAGWAIAVGELTVDWLTVPVREVGWRLCKLYWLQHEFLHSDKPLPFIEDWPAPVNVTGYGLPQWAVEQYRTPPRPRRLIPFEPVLDRGKAVVKMCQAWPSSQKTLFTLLVKGPQVSNAVWLRVGNGYINQKFEFDPIDRVYRTKKVAKLDTTHEIVFEGLPADAILELFEESE